MALVNILWRRNRTIVTVIPKLDPMGKRFSSEIKDIPKSFTRYQSEYAMCDSKAIFKVQREGHIRGARWCASNVLMRLTYVDLSSAGAGRWRGNRP